MTNSAPLWGGSAQTPAHRRLVHLTRHPDLWEDLDWGRDGGSRPRRHAEPRD